MNIDSSKQFLPKGRTDSYLVRHMDAHDVTRLRNAGLVHFTSTQHLDNNVENTMKASQRFVHMCVRLSNTACIVKALKMYYIAESVIHRPL